MHALTAYSPAYHSRPWRLGSVDGLMTGFPASVETDRKTAKELRLHPGTKERSKKELSTSFLLGLLTVILH